MPTREGMKLSSGTLYFASSGEKIVEVNEVVLTEEDISCKSKDEKQVFSPKVMTTDTFTATIKLKKPVSRKLYNATLRKITDLSYTEYLFPKKRKRSRSRRRRNFFKKMDLSFQTKCFNRFVISSDVGREVKTYHENDTNTRFDCSN